jgi:arylamine N-acetyltransferase
MIVTTDDARSIPPQKKPSSFFRLPTFIGASSPLVSSSLSSSGGYCDSSDNDEDEDDIAMMMKYLDRIGMSRNQAQALLLGDDVDADNSKARTKSGTRRSPNLADLQQLLTAHLLTVPFENLDQHSHPVDANDDDDDDSQNIITKSRAKFIPRKQPDDLPSLDVKRSLHKICHIRGRGGFCYELNLSFAWLLRTLGFGVRLAVADVACTQDIPAHVIVLVDGLLVQTHTIDDVHDKDENRAAAKTAVLVDVGFGTPGVCNVVLPLVLDEPTFDTHGDSFRFARCEQQDGRRFDTVLYRTRRVVGNPGTTNVEEEPMYRFCSKDDLPHNAEEFALGLNHVLNKSPTFTQKRLCVRSTEKGHCTLGEGHVKWVEQGRVIQTVELGSETEWRQALWQHFGMVL